MELLMTTDFILCTNCERHIKASESVCPFCSASLQSTTTATNSATAVTALMALSLAVGASHCGPSFQYSNPPQTVIVVTNPTPTPPVRPPPSDPIVVIRNINPTPNPQPITQPTPPAPEPVPDPILQPDPIRYAVPAYGVSPYDPRRSAPMYGVPPRRVR